jgi:hypothetical protein
MPVADPRQPEEHAEMATVEPGDSPQPVGAAGDDYLDEQEDESFPASDPHSDWAGPPT